MSSQGGPGTEATASGKSNILRASKLSNFGSGSSGSPARSGPTTAAAETSASAVAAASPGAKKLFTALKPSKLAAVSGGSGGLKSNPFASSSPASSSDHSTNPFCRTTGTGAGEKPVCTASAPNPFSVTKFGKSTPEKDDADHQTSSDASNPFKAKVPAAAASSSPEVDKKEPKDAANEEEKKKAEETSGEVSSKTDATNGSSKKEPEPESFVFGQNLADRAANFAEMGDSKPDQQAAPPSFTFGQNLTARAEPPAAASEGDKAEPDTAESADEATHTSESATEPPDTPAGKTLSENAEDFMNSKSAQKRKYDEVEVTTGEENEFNVIQTRAKLYFFENSNWVERGRGQLRLNDMTAEADAAAGKHDGAGAKISSKVSSSRIVMRTMGSLKVILNTKVYKGMSVEAPNEKSVRMTGVDESGNVKVYLVMCSAKDASALYKALKSRLAELNRTTAATGSDVTAAAAATKETAETEASKRPKTAAPAPPPPSSMDADDSSSPKNSTGQ